MAAKVFIDGEAGTTGLQIRERLLPRADVELLSLSEESRKDAGARAEMLNAADVSILCLPDAAAREAVAMIENPAARVIDASTAHRVSDGWTFGFPELDADQTAEIAVAKRVANPGCYAIASIALLRPLVDAGIVPSDYPVTINAVSGYSGGGKSMIDGFENPASPNRLDTPIRVYALGLTHKHVPEIKVHSRLAATPLFVPSVGRYYQGMIVQVPLHLASLPGKPAAADLHGALARRYAGRRFVTVAPLDRSLAMAHIDPEGLNGTNELRLFVCANESAGQVLLLALLDNLGKGASGQAVQNMNIMLGFDEGAGLDEAPRRDAAE